MVPQNTNHTFSKNRGPDQVGYMWSNLDDFLRGKGNLCGIYEWRATRDDQPNRVVYVGSTCTRGNGCSKLRSRIRGYCTDGNHKADLINDALEKGYKLEVRYKKAANVDDARKKENQLLDKYDYAWNIRSNGSVRKILPKRRGASNRGL